MPPSLFDATAHRPLADLMRPLRLEDVVGQGHLIGPGKPLTRMVAAGRLSSMVLCGPPGVGKTTIARILARGAGLAMEDMSAVLSGLPDVRKALEAARGRKSAGGGATALFLDEIHRASGALLDALLPMTEDGTIVLIGATTENPSMAVNAAILSRATVFMLRRLDAAGLDGLVTRAEASLGRDLPLTPEARGLLLELADGDGRYLLGLVERLSQSPDGDFVGPDELLEIAQRKAASHDKAGDQHYALLSALQKSIRGSDPDASLYWLARALRGGEPPKSLFRRLCVMATEEIGLADPQAVQHTAACAALFDRVGEPEGLPILGQCVLYLATAVKSNAAYTAFYEAMRLAEAHGSPPPPAHLLNARSVGSDPSGYLYDHDFVHAFSGQEFMPDPLAGDRRPVVYRPNERGNEREVGKRVSFWAGLRSNASGG